MSKENIIAGLVFGITGAILLAFSPDTLSLIFVGIMCCLLIVGYIYGVLFVSKYAKAFYIGKRSVEHAKKVQTDNIFLAVEQEDDFFHHEFLNKVLEEYKETVNKAELKEFNIKPDIETLINEDVIAAKTWKNILDQFPGTFTGIGLLGTFIGLILGISNIGFSSVTATITSIELLISGIKVAFYTSIAGVIISIIYNIFAKLSWNIMLRELFSFIYEFHKSVIPSEDSQIKMIQSDFYCKMLTDISKKDN